MRRFNFLTPLGWSFVAGACLWGLLIFAAVWR